ncbi:MAG: hypothetical protein AB1898_21040 [Acidobacteriota bacterium]
MFHLLDTIGWTASGIFASSYFFKQPNQILRVQALAALVWIGYGILLKSPPIVTANLIVAVAASYSSFRRGAGKPNQSERADV